MDNTSTYVAIDAHKESLSVAMLVPSKDTPIEWRVANDMANVQRMARKISKEATGSVRCCYEAGPCGYVLQRQLAERGLACAVVAPSLIPRKPGDRIKTDRRDARKLVELFRAGLLTEVHPPTEQEEAVRDLCRCRAAAKRDQMAHRHQLAKFLLRRGLLYGSGVTWTRRHLDWLRALSFEEASTQAAFDSYLLAVEQCDERVKALNESISAVIEGGSYRESVGWLRCFRGVDTVTAATFVSELHGFGRFESPRSLMAYLGLVPSEHTSGQHQRRGGITRAGNNHVRRVLIEAAWHYRHRPSHSPTLGSRRKGQPGWVVSIADKAGQRLHRRFLKFILSGKQKNVATVAVARELVGFLWAVLHRANVGAERAAQGGLAVAAEN